MTEPNTPTPAHEADEQESVAPTTEATADTAPPEQSEAKTVGKGLLVITAAKLWFMVGGALITFGLPYIFSRYGDGDPEYGKRLYGQFFDINNTMSILSMVLVTGCLQAVSKWTSQFSQQPERAAGALRQLFWFMLGAAGLIGGGFILASPWIAESRGNPELVNAYRAAGGVLVAYSLYVVFIGALNGRKAFTSQALFDMGFTTLKASLVLGFALLGWGVTGAFGGFAAAAGVIALLAAWRVGLGPKGEPSPYKEVYGFALQAMAYTLVFNLIFKLDILMVKPVAQSLFQGEADALMGVYGMAVNVSRLPWQATIAVTFVIFPLLSEATFSQDMERSRAYIRQTLRYLMLLIGAASAGLMALPEAVVNILPSGYADAAQVLMWSAPAYFFFTLFNLTNTLLISAGRALDTFLIGLITVGLAAGLYQLWLPSSGSGVELITRAASASLVAFGFGLTLGLGRLYQLFGPPVPLMSAVRLAISSAVIWALGRQTATALEGKSKLLFLVALVGLGLLYFVLLTALREWDDEDKARVKRMLKRG